MDVVAKKSSSKSHHPSATKMTRWKWHQLDHMQIICTLLQTDNHARFFTGWKPFLPTNQHRQSTEGLEDLLLNKSAKNSNLVYFNRATLSQCGICCRHVSVQCGYSVPAVKQLTCLQWVLHSQHTQQASPFCHQGWQRGLLQMTLVRIFLQRQQKKKKPFAGRPVHHQTADF